MNVHFTILILTTNVTRLSKQTNIIKYRYQNLRSVKSICSELCSFFESKSKTKDEAFSYIYIKKYYKFKITFAHEKKITFRLINPDRKTK